VKTDPSQPHPPPPATLDEIGSMDTIVTKHEPAHAPAAAAPVPPAHPATIETSPDMPTIAMANPSRALPAATMHSAGSVSSMGGKSKSQAAMESVSGEDGWISDRYRLLDKLGEGGFGVVYRAEQVKPLHRLVAVKILKAGMDSAVIFGRFAAERQTLALMEHENIARVLDAGETDRGLPYFVMELVKGRSITSYCSQNEIDLLHRLELFIPVCQAVHHAHQKSIIHRDLKPSNILITDEGGRITPKVIDFGIAKVLEGRDISQADFTGVDQLVGTPGYISPEQIEHGSSHVDTRSDVYALGAILFELLTGKALVTPADVAAKPVHVLLRELAERDAPKASTYAPELAGDLDWIVMKALERDPERRYGSADDLAEDISRFLTFQPIKARPPSRSYLIGRFVRRHRIGVAAVSAVALAVLGGGITSTALYFEAEANRLKAEHNEQLARQSDSQGDEQMARQYADRGQFQDATAHLVRALRTEPRNQLAATNLYALLTNVHLMRPVTQRLELPPETQEARLTAFSRQAGIALAVSTVVSERLEPPLQHVRLPLHEVISIWDISKPRRIDSPLPEGINVTILEVTRDGQQAIVGKTDGTVELWSLKDGKRRLLQPRLPNAVLSVAFSGDGHTLVAGSESVEAQGGQGFCHVWDLRQPQTPARVFPHKKAVISLDVDETGELAVAAASEGIAQAWDLKTLTVVGEPIEVDEGLASVAVNRKRQIVAVGMNNGTVFVGSYARPDEQPLVLSHPTAVRAMHITPDGATLHVGDGGGYMHVWNLETAQPRQPATLHDGEIMLATVSDESGLVASVSRHGEVQVWNPQTGERRSQRLQYSVSAASITDDGSMLLLAPRKEPFVQLWNIHQTMATRRYAGAPSQALITRPDPPENSPAFLRESKAASWNRSNTHIIAADAEGAVAVFDVKRLEAAGKTFRHPPAVGATALTSDGKLAVTSGRDQVVRVWDVSIGTQVASMRHGSFVEVIALTPDDRHVVTFTESGEMRVWDIRTGDCLTPAIRVGGSVVQARVEDDGARVLFRLAQRGWFTLPIPVEAASTPEWFLRFAESLAGRRRTADRRGEELTLKDVEAAVAAIPATPDAGERFAVRVARWLLEDPAKRALSPDLDEPLADYLAVLAKDNAPTAVEELKRFQTPASK
jgi:serine/threonine protein kinase/WD40 repeat protein